MHWYLYVAYFFAGAFFAKAVPHYVSGICGRSFPTPFASPPGRRLSSPMLNVFWGTFNAVVGYFLVCHVGEFHIRRLSDVLVSGAGSQLMEVMLARAFGRRFSGNQQRSIGVTSWQGCSLWHHSLNPPRNPILRRSPGQVQSSFRPRRWRELRCRAHQKMWIDAVEHLPVHRTPPRVLLCRAAFCCY